MSSAQTSVAPDLLVGLDRDADAPLGAQLQEQLRDAIRSGRLSPDERLPSSRRLAGELDVSRGLVVDTYSQLEAEGYLSTVPGSGTLVACRAAPQCATSAPVPTLALDVDFAYGVPDLLRFPMRDWMRAMADAANDPITALSNRDHRGLVELRDVVTRYVRRVRAAECDADDIVICAGYVQALGLITAVLAQTGRPVIAVEDPRPDGTEQVIARANGVPVAIPVDSDGLSVDALAASTARSVVVTPAHQAPTGVVMSPVRRQALVEWARATDGYIIEDDYDAEFRYDRQPVGSLQGLARDRVVSIGTVSKSLAPGLRLAWMICPRALVDAVITEKDLADRGSPGLEQLALASLIDSGRYDRHLRRMRTLYAERRAALVSAMTELVPSATLCGLDAGLHAVLALDPTLDETEVIVAAQERSIGVYGMSSWRSDLSTTPPELVLGFGNLTPAAIRRGIGTIADIITPC